MSEPHFVAANINTNKLDEYYPNLVLANPYAAPMGRLLPCVLSLAARIFKNQTESNRKIYAFYKSKTKTHGN